MSGCVKPPSHIQDTSPAKDAVAEIERLAATVEALHAELERSHRLATLGTVAGSIAHEFNNLLTPVLSYAQMALSAPADLELTAKALRKTVEGVERASRVASAMLGFVRQEDSVLCANVREAAEAAVGCLGRDVGSHGVAIRVDCSTDVCVGMMPIALQQLMLNLILNAIEAMDGGPGSIHIHRSTWNTPHQLCIEVVDTGRGMSAELVARIFEPFVSERRSPGASPGTGLGLAICRRLVEEVGGGIEVQSVVGEGTTFRLLLPTTTK